METHCSFFYFFVIHSRVRHILLSSISASLLLLGHFFFNDKTYFILGIKLRGLLMTHTVPYHRDGHYDPPSGVRYYPVFRSFGAKILLFLFVKIPAIYIKLYAENERKILSRSSLYFENRGNDVIMTSFAQASLVGYLRWCQPTFVVLISTSIIFEVTTFSK